MRSAAENPLFGGLFGGRSSGAAGGGGAPLTLPQLPQLPDLFGGGWPTAPESASSGRRAPGTGKTIFVAGATGRLGARVVRALLAADPTTLVRAGARDVDSAAAGLAAAVRAGLIAPADARRVEIVSCDLTDEPTIPSALRGVDVVVQCIGAPETGGDLSAPARIDGDAAIALVQAATAARVSFYIMVTSLGTGKVGFPAAVLNLFGGILTQKRRAEVALEASGVPYLIVRPGGLERPRDDHDLTHAVVISPRDTLFGGQLSRAQVARFIAAAVGAPDVAENKCVELVSEVGARRQTDVELLASITSDEDQTTRLDRLSTVKAATAAADDARAALTEAAEAAAAAKEAVAEAVARAKTTASAAAAARAEAEPALRAYAAATAAIEAATEAADRARAEEGAAKAVLAAAQAAARRGEVLSEAAIEEISLPFLNPAEVERRAAAEREAAQAAAEAAAAAAAERRRVAEAEAAARAAESAAAREQAEQEAAAARAQAEAEAEAEAAAARAKAEQAAAAARAQAEAEAAARKQEEERAAEAARAAAAEQEAARAAAEAKAEADAAAAAAAAAAAPAASGDVPDNVADARAWIAAWREKANVKA